MKMVNIENSIHLVKTVIDLQKIVESLRVLAANEKSERILKIVNLAMKKSFDIEDQISMVNILELRIKQLFGSFEDLSQIEKDLSLMKQISKNIGYQEGMILAFSIKWGIARFRGNEDRSSRILQKSIDLLEKCDNCSNYTYYITRYSYAINKWRKERDPECVDILEECIQYFERKGYIKGLIRGFGYLGVMYCHLQKRKGLQNLTRSMYNKLGTAQLPLDLQAVMRYFLGATLELNFILSEAENHLISSKKFFETSNLKNKNIVYYLPTLSHLSTTQALLGNLAEAKKNNEALETILNGNLIRDILDHKNKGQLFHNLNLTTFYIQTRLQGFCVENKKNSIHSILDNIDEYHSNVMLLTEFLLNAELTNKQLFEIKMLNNPSTRRVEHILNFLIEKTTQTEEKQIMNLISTLKKRPVEERMTLVEQAFADLLAAQEYYKLNRFAEISPLLSKYKNQLHRIEILELRIFMEAFIQVGAYKNGDSLGPALQYMAIKKCRDFGFSRLENKLLDYLNLQGKDILKIMT